jgi:transposase
MGKLYVGIDISKERSSAKGIDEHGKSHFGISFDMEGAGFADLLKAIEDNSNSYEDVVGAMESTACYHINLYSFLTAKGIESFVINPLLIANFAKLSLRKTKTDKKDAGMIAQFILAHKDSVKQLAVSQDLQDTRDMARERESLCHQISAAQVEIRRLLHTTFPELESMCNPFTKSNVAFYSAVSFRSSGECGKSKEYRKDIKRKAL